MSSILWQEDYFFYRSENFESYMRNKKLRGQPLGTDISNNDVKVQFLGGTWVVSGPTVYHDVGVRTQNNCQKHERG